MLGDSFLKFWDFSGLLQSITVPRNQSYTHKSIHRYIPVESVHH